MPAYQAGDLLLAYVSIDDSAGTSAQTIVGGRPVPYVLKAITGGTVFSDVTEFANEATAGDWTISPTAPAVNDACYFGSPDKFTQINVVSSVLAVATTNPTWVVEYWSGAAWTTLTTTTNTFGANMKPTATVHAELIFAVPANWATTTVNGIAGQYWVRFRCSVTGTYTTAGLQTQAWIVPDINSTAVSNRWRQLFSYYAGTTPSPISAVWKYATADERDTTFFYTSPETANVELIAIRDVETIADSGVITAAVNATNRTYIRSTGSWVTDGFQVGMQINITGSTSAGNNYFRQIESISTTTNPNDTITVTSGTGLITEAGTVNQRVISFPFNVTVTGVAPASGNAGYTASNAALYRNALPTYTTNKNDCLLIYSANPDGVGIPSIIEGPCQLIAGKDGSAHSDGFAWGYQRTAGTTSNAVFMTQMSALVTEMTIVAINPPYSGPLIRPAYTITDASVYVNPLSNAAFGTDSAAATSVTTPFTGKLNGRPIAAGAVAATTDVGLNSYHAVTQVTGLTTNGTFAGIRNTIASRNFANKNILIHFQPATPVALQTTDKVTLDGACGVAFGLASAAGRYKVYHIGGSGVPSDFGRHQPAIVHTAATAGVLSQAGSFAVSGGAGTFVATSRIYVGASWATATKRAFIISVSGTSPTQTINYSTLGGYGYTTNFVAGDAIKEYTVSNINGATGTAGTVSTLVDTAVVDLGFFVSGKTVAPIWMFASMWALDTWVGVGGISTAPMDLPQIVSCYADGHERRSAIQQGSKQALFLGPVQIGDGTNSTYLLLDGTAIEFPQQYNKDAKQVFYNSVDNFAGLTYYAAASDTIIHRNSVISSGSRFKWGLHASSSTAATYDFSGTAVIGAGTITLNRAITITELTINDYSSIDASGLTLTYSAIKNVPVTNDSITLTALSNIDYCTIDVTKVSASNRWCSVADPTIFVGNTFIGTASTGHAIRITTPGTYAFVGNKFTGFGADGSNSAAIFNESGGLVTLNITDGDTPTFRNGAGASTVINNAKTFSVANIIDGSEVRLYKASDLTELGGAENISASPTGLNAVTVQSDPDNAGRFIMSYSYNYTADTPIIIVALNNQYQVLRNTSTIKSTSQTFTINQLFDRQYQNL
jgi:hypothetical protein